MKDKQQRRANRKEVRTMRSIAKDKEAVFIKVYFDNQEQKDQIIEFCKSMSDSTKTISPGEFIRSATLRTMIEMSRRAQESYEKYKEIADANGIDNSGNLALPDEAEKLGIEVKPDLNLEQADEGEAPAATQGDTGLAGENMGQEAQTPEGFIPGNDRGAEFWEPADAPGAEKGTPIILTGGDRGPSARSDNPGPSEGLPGDEGDSDDPGPSEEIPIGDSDDTT